MAKLMPDNWEPPYPAFVSDVDRTHLNISQIAIQAPDADAGANDFEELTQHLAGAGGLLHHEHAYHVDEVGLRNDILVTYWDRPGDFSAWRSKDGAREFIERNRTGDVGLWIESLSSPAQNFETNNSRGNIDWGITRHHATHEDPVHGYYGAMRDRIAAAEDGGLASPIGRLSREQHADSRGRLLQVELPENVCFIRTVQGWLACTDEEREYFMERTYPVYQEGVAFLASHPVQTNCISARLVTDVDQHPDCPQSETLAWFVSLTDLEAWTWSHPTHEAIFGSFMEHARRFNFEVDILLGHEVAVVPKGGGRAEYNNCHPATGFLRFFEAHES
jgi:aldoxime dehydratase